MTFRAALLAAALVLPLPPSPHPRPRSPSAWRARMSGRLDPHFAVSTTRQGGDRLDVQRVGALQAGHAFARRHRARPGAKLGELSPDKKAWTFHLRHGVQFPGGYGELTADDVVFSLQEIRRPEALGRSADFAAFDKMAAIDPYTVGSR